ncbi:unnamed protein product [Sphagnum troendelagicum]|uniref:Uncharacterized protein n=1 Tax=Sphagnum troendelagicum TaxID=128251 RepID=A0ABP0TW63_9BRYO
MLVELNQKTALGVPGTAIRLSRANITSSILLKVGLSLPLSLCLSIISSILSPVYHKYNARTVIICKGTREHAKLQTIPHLILSKLPDKSLVNAAGWNID